MSECTYVKPWIGNCGDETDPQSDDRCTEHMEKTCLYCDSKASHGCSITHGALVCGFPLCDNKSCKSKHINKSHS